MCVCVKHSDEFCLDRDNYNHTHTHTHAHAIFLTDNSDSAHTQMTFGKMKPLH